MGLARPRRPSVDRTAMTDTPPSRARRRGRGFAQAGGLIAPRLAQATGKRGFAVARLLTRWDAIAGPDFARLARPVRIGYGARDGLGATLTLAARGADAPRLQAESARLIARVNAAYGYAAIARIRIVQTGAPGLAEAAAPWQPEAAPAAEPDTKTREQARRTAAPVQDPGLRAALEELGGHVLTRPRP
jgi:hypothetical protein